MNTILGDLFGTNRDGYMFRPLFWVADSNFVRMRLQNDASVSSLDLLVQRVPNHHHLDTVSVYTNYFPVTKVFFATTKRFWCVVGLSLCKWDRVSSQFL